MEGDTQMSEGLKLESRTGRAGEKSGPIYNFLTDMRNFGRFIPGEVITEWEAERERCSFVVSPVGRAEMTLAERDENRMVKYEGTGLNGTGFTIWIQLKEGQESETHFRITLKAGLNPVIAAMAKKPLNDFLEKLVTGIEKWSDWDTLTE
jgi:carbon monoxide dehydrogenase subunit G